MTLPAKRLALDLQGNRATPCPIIPDGNPEPTIDASQASYRHNLQRVARILLEMRTVAHAGTGQPAWVTTRGGEVVAWSTSDRRYRLPKGWATTRAEVKRRAGGKCEAMRHVPECSGLGTDADHIVQGDNHSLNNLQWLSEPCHRAKTARETAERNTRNAQLKRRPQEPHPGAIQ